MAILYLPIIFPGAYSSIANFHFSRVALARALILEILPPPKNSAAPMHKVMAGG
ncbi:MAG: hypothetical protein M0Z50_04420 [Planctomycetia bacterium]|nr:hypothetical protein [Planctomycetia bacterium]